MTGMTLRDRFDTYLEALAPQLGHADRLSGFKDYCYGLMLSLTRKSIESIAESVDPQHVQARHQALHHLVGKAPWSDRAADGRGAMVLPHLLSGATLYWIIDDTAIRKKRQHSVGVSRQYRGEIGKQDNCQAAASLSVATERASLPVAWRLYLPTSLSPRGCPDRGHLCHQTGDRLTPGSRDVGRRHHTRHRAGGCGLRQGHDVAGATR